ncbi:DUF4440 domain-containing protein [Streptomyces sp. NPDC014861]|uniref:DUF4440 domain-containing protein n=1 Tax=Streptomyces sp. NPDC014861 TaxID=3364923 RepID=UPI0036FE2455
MHDDAVVTALGARFDADEVRLRGVALRLLGAGAEREAEAALDRVRAELGSGAPDMARLLLTALVARACLDAAGHARVGAGEGPPEPVAEGLDEAVLLGFLGVLDRLGDRRRLAYLLHDVFGLAPGETARVMGGSAAGAAREARRARERLRGGGAVGDGATAWDGGQVRNGGAAWDGGQVRNGGAAREGGPVRHDDTARSGAAAGNGGAARNGDAARHGGALRDGDAAGAGGGPGRRRTLVDAFLAAARARDAGALAALLDPEAVAYTEGGPVHGAAAVAPAAAAALSVRSGRTVRPALVEGAAGLVAFAAGHPVGAVAFGFRGERIVTLDITTAPERLRALDLIFPDA